MRVYSVCVGAVTIGQVVRAGPSEKMVLEIDDLNAVGEKDFWGKSIPGRRNSVCKGPEAEMYCLKVQQETQRG